MNENFLSPWISWRQSSYSFSINFFHIKKKKVLQAHNFRTVKDREILYEDKLFGGKFYAEQI